MALKILHQTGLHIKAYELLLGVINDTQLLIVLDG